MVGEVVPRLGKKRRRDLSSQLQRTINDLSRRDKHFRRTKAYRTLCAILRSIDVPVSLSGIFKRMYSRKRMKAMNYKSPLFKLLVKS